MLNCSKTQELLSQYATGELINPVRQQVSTHLQKCSTCRQELDTEMELLTMLGNLPLVSCPELVTDNILKVIEEEERQQKTFSSHWPLAATGLLAAGLALILFLPRGELMKTPNAVGTSDSYSSLEIQAATNEARFALAKIATVINQKEKNVLERVFAEEIPDAVGASLLQLTKNLQGEV